MINQTGIHPTDFNKSSEELATILINAANKTNFYYSKLIFGKPQLLDITPNISNDFNTYVTLNTDESYNAVYEIVGKPKGILYWRIPIDLLNFDMTSFLTANPNLSNEFTLYDNLAAINTLVSAQLTENDILNQTFNKTTGDASAFKLTTNPESLVWLNTGITPVIIDNTHYRDEEDGTHRQLEDGTYRILEN